MSKQVFPFGLEKEKVSNHLFPFSLFGDLERGKGSNHLSPCGDLGGKTCRKKVAFSPSAARSGQGQRCCELRYHVPGTYIPVCE